MLSYLIIFLFGTILGSFLNCLVFREKTKRSIIKERRSFCPKCNHVLGFFDLIPIFSYLFLKGKCRYCNQRISLYYPIVEFLMGSLAIFIYLKSDSFLLFFLYLFLWLFLVAIFLYDLKYYLIPDKFILFSGILIIIYLGAEAAKGNFLFLLNNLLTGFFISLFFFFIWFFSKGEAMGFGDVKIAFLAGLFLGPKKGFVAFSLSFIIGAIVGIILILFRKKNLKSKVPFAPFLVTGIFLSLFFWEKIYNFLTLL